MDVQKLMESGITRKAQTKADELGIKFKVKCSIKNHSQDVLVRIRRKELYTEELVKRQNEFVDFIYSIIVPKYASQVRFTYPTKL